MMVTRHFTVIGDENNQRVFQQAALRECIDDPANLFVHMADRAVIPLPAVADFPVG